MYRPKNSTGIYQNLDMRLHYLKEKSVLMVTIVKKIKAGNHCVGKR
jgi:hypothetical protein